MSPRLRDAEVGGCHYPFVLPANTICILFQDASIALVLAEERGSSPGTDHHPHADLHIPHASFPSPHVCTGIAASLSDCQQMGNPSMKSTERKKLPLIVFLKSSIKGFPLSLEF